MSKPSLNLLASLALLVVVSAQAVPNHLGLPTPDGLTRLFFNSRLTHQDPQTSVACFAGYIGEANLITQKYSEDFSGCLTNATNSRRGIEWDFIPARRKMERMSESVCKALTSCGKEKDTLNSFNCHASVGSTNTILTYSIYGNASDSAILLQEGYRVIDLHHEQCKKKANHIYVEFTTRNYNYLQGCLDGRIKPKPVPTTTSSTSTTTTTTTTTTTEPPTTTSTTEIPMTTDGNVEDRFKELLNLLN